LINLTMGAVPIEGRRVGSVKQGLRGDRSRVTIAGRTPGAAA
jgi:hypothetical protein